MTNVIDLTERRIQRAEHAVTLIATATLHRFAALAQSGELKSALAHLGFDKGSRIASEAMRTELKRMLDEVEQHSWDTPATIEHLAAVASDAVVSASVNDALSACYSTLPSRYSDGTPTGAK